VAKSKTGASQGHRLLLRATFNEVVQNQIKLIKILDKLIAKNRPLKPSERLDFLETLACSTLGLGTRMKLDFDGSASFILKPIDAQVPIQNPEDFITFLAFYEGSAITQGGKELPISKFWNHARSLIFKIRPFAIEKACSISAEHIDHVDRRAKGGEGMMEREKDDQS